MVMCGMVWCGVLHVLFAASRFIASGRESMVDQYQGNVDETNAQKKRLDQERGSLEGEKNELQEKLSKAEV